MNEHDPKRREILRKLGLLGTAAAAPIVTCGCNSVTSLFTGHDHSHDHKNEGQVEGAKPKNVLKNDIDLAENQRHDLSSGNVKLAHGNHGNQNRLIEKSRNFDLDYSDDVYFKGEKYDLLVSVVDKLNKLQRYVGHGHFNVVDWKDGIIFTRKAKGTGKGFSAAEIAFLEEIFYKDAADYGFMGDKVFDEIELGINRKNTVKVPYTGHYLVRGPSHELYKKIRKKVGKDLILTSGVRGTMKQFHLFLKKVVACNGNASRASRSIAPPGYSFHGRGDFDIGSKLLGEKNFTSEFANTDEYKRLVDLGFVNIRYEKDNLEGVRFEPWHIKVDS